MDDQMNQGSMPAGPAQDSDVGAQGPVFQTPSSGAGGVSGEMGGMTPSQPPPMGGSMESEDPHEKILATLAKIEEKLAAIAAKLGA